MRRAWYRATILFDLTFVRALLREVVGFRTYSEGWSVPISALTCLGLLPSLSRHRPSTLTSTLTPPLRLQKLQVISPLHNHDPWDQDPPPSCGIVQHRAYASRRAWSTQNSLVRPGCASEYNLI